jgi:hypothetical protein
MQLRYTGVHNALDDVASNAIYARPSHAVALRDRSLRLGAAVRVGRCKSMRVLEATGSSLEPALES